MTCLVIYCCILFVQESIKRYFTSPFVSEEDWKFAEWLIEEDIGKSAGDRLMSIKKVMLKYFEKKSFLSIK